MISAGAKSDGSVMAVNDEMDSSIPKNGKAMKHELDSSVPACTVTSTVKAPTGFVGGEYYEFKHAV